MWLWAVVITLAGCSFGWDCRAQEKQTAIRRALEEVHDKQQNVGLSAAVLCDGRMIFSEGLGLADLEHRVPVKRETRFAIASVTKAFTAAALLKLHEKGRFDLDAPIQKYVPDFPPKPGPAITARLLAAHLAGIRHYRDGERTAQFLATHYENISDALALFKNDPLAGAPGSAYHYSSYGYNLLAAAIQAAAGEPFEKFVKEQIFTPLGLENTLFDEVRRPIRNRARNYSFYHPTTYEPSPGLLRVPDWDYSYNMGGGNMLSTAEDLVRFGRVFVQPGFFSAASIALLHRPQRTSQTESPWSYGWFVRTDSSGRRLLRVTGSFPGVQAGLVVYPDHDLTIAILSNTWGIGSASGEMVSDLPARVAEICLAPDRK